MFSTTKLNVLFTSMVLLTVIALVGVTSQPADAQTTTVISFEQSEGFPAPVLIPNPADPNTGMRDPNFNFTGFAGGANTGYPAHPGG